MVYLYYIYLYSKVTVKSLVGCTLELYPLSCESMEARWAKPSETGQRTPTNVLVNDGTMMDGAKSGSKFKLFFLRRTDASRKVASHGGEIAQDAQDQRV